MKKKRIKQKEDKKTDRKHGNRTRKAILGILSVLVLLCLNSCGRELEEREFPDTLVIRDSALPFEKSLQTEQDKSSKYLDYGQVRCILLEDDLAEDDEKLGEVLLALEKTPGFFKKYLFFHSRWQSTGTAGETERRIAGFNRILSEKHRP